MYAIIEKTHLRAIAFHDDKDAIDKYFDTLGRDTDRYWCGKVSKQNAKKIRSTNEYQELYLIQVGDILVPAKYYNAAEYLYEDIKYTYNTMIRNLERELEYSDILGIILSDIACSRTEIFIGTYSLLISAVSPFFSVRRVFAIEAVV